MLIVNGFATSWSDIKFGLEGIPLSGITEVSYGDNIAEELGYGQSQAPTRRSVGQYVCDDASIKGFASSIDEVLKYFASQSTPPGVWSASEVTFTISFAGRGVEPTRQHVLQRCRCLGVPETFSDGSGILMAELKLKPMAIVRDGLTGYQRTLPF